MFRRVQYLIEAGAFFTLIGLFGLLDLERASALGGFISRTLGPLTPLHDRARARMQRVMPELSSAQAKKILRDMWDNLGRTIGELPHLDEFRPFQPGGHVEVCDLAIANAVRDRNVGAIWVSGHFANWEILPVLITRFGINGAVVYRAPNNPYVDRYLFNLRRKHGCPLQFPKGPKGVRGIVAHLKERGHLAMLVDQRMSDGVEVPFFGIPSMTSAAAAQLALRHNVPIIVARIVRLNGPEFRVHLFEPIEPLSTGDRIADIKAMMTKVNAHLEEAIRARPHEWLWLHRRWAD